MSGDFHNPELESSIWDALDRTNLSPITIDSCWREYVKTLAAHSPRLSSILVAKPFYLHTLIERNDIDAKTTIRVLQKDVQFWVHLAGDFDLGIRMFHRYHLIRIALRDLSSLADIQQITRECSLLADEVLRLWFNETWNAFVNEHGTPVRKSDGAPASMVVVALGKHGGYELNFSSDIDLLFVYDEDGPFSGSTKRFQRNKEFFIALAQEYCDHLNQATADGFLYRIDTRLRPEGGSGELATSLMGIEVYYHTYGQNWERQALLKARCIAGNSDLCSRLNSIIAPFTYRKYVDEVEVNQVLRDVHAMRVAAMKECGGEDALYVNFKNGYGGIRDIEFFVQAVQILYGGQYPEVKLTGTLLSLKRMHESHLLHSKDYNLFTDAYRFLRTIEHRMQMVDEQQVYSLPDEPMPRMRLAAGMGYASWEEFLEDYRRITKEVRSVYETVFLRDELTDSSLTILEADKLTTDIETLLQHYEFRDTSRAFAFLKALQEPSSPHLRSKQFRLLKSLLPRLLFELKSCPDPDLSLVNFEKVVSAFQAKTALLETLIHQTPLLKLLVSVVCPSEFLTRLVLRDPSLIDSIGNDELIHQTLGYSALNTHLDLIRTAYPKEPLREHLLRVQNAAMLHSGIRFLLGLSTIESIGGELAAIADFVIHTSCIEIDQKLEERFPRFTRNHAGKLAIIAYGKLGGRDFNVASDCDLVLVYEDDIPVEEVSSSEYFQRWSTEFVKYLQEKSLLGFLYEPDLRLRPYGSNSPLAVSWSRLREYYRNEAQLWERLAFSRARAITGWATIAARLPELQHEICYSKPLTPDDAQAILDMRTKVEQEKGSDSLKSTPGGLLDVEFIAQALSLHLGSRFPSLRSSSTLAILREAGELECVPGLDVVQLTCSYLFLREIENRLRIVNNTSMDSIPNDKAELEQITRRYALRIQNSKPTSEELISWITTHTSIIRTQFQYFFTEYLQS